MNDSRRCSRALTITCLLAVAALQAGADMIYSSGFESPTYSIGDLVGQDSWLGSGPVGDEPAVQSGVVYGGGQAGAGLRLGTDLGTSIETYRNFTLASGIVRVQTAMRVEDMVSSSDNWDAFTVYRDGPGGGGNRATIFYFRGNGNVTVFDGGTERTISSWVDDTWYQLDFLFDTSSQTFDLSVNGSPVATNFAFLEAGATEIGGVYYQEYGGLQGGGMYFDDLSVETIPEPTTLGLMAASAILLMLRRAARG